MEVAHDGSSDLLGTAFGVPEISLCNIVPVLLQPDHDITNCRLAISCAIHRSEGKLAFHIYSSCVCG